MNIKIKTSIHPYINEVENRMRAQFSGYPPTLVATLEQLILSGGKHFRPNAILLIGNMFETEQDILLNLAAAIEMMHTATQVHGDLTVQPDQQFGQKTVNARFSTSATVLAGDFAFAASAQLAAATNHITVMQKFSETLQFIVNGEITYMFNNGDRRDLEAYYDWIHAKSASVFELATGMAALLGSANPAEIDAAAQFGYNLGMAYQITDDVLDFVGDPSGSKKPVGNDLRQGRLTLPTLFFLEGHPDKLDIGVTLNKNGNGQGNIENIINQIRQSEAIDQATQEADRFLQHGLDALAMLPNTSERAELGILARQITNLDLSGKGFQPAYV